MQKRPLISKPTNKTLTHIKQHPGIRYRQLLRLSGLANGALSFHLKKLKKLKVIKVKKLGYNRIRFYPTAIKTAESDILDHLLDSTRRKIILFLLEYNNCKFQEIVHYIDRARLTGISRHVKTTTEPITILQLGKLYKDILYSYYFL